ncbi:MAG: DnaB-like helicase C-terminal domain-containing protein [Desulfocapsaceae bacterium]|nr:DnaB-like helicase C-terminal domain-containing protein [Desulfocapsaceae bacterium]
MTEYVDAIAQFYQTHLPGGRLEKNILTADCPFCSQKGGTPAGKIVVFLNGNGFFYGYFRCLNRCLPGGFPLWFARNAGISPTQVPGFDPDREPFLLQTDYPARNMNAEIKTYQDRMMPEILARFQQADVSFAVLQEMGIGFNGRYIVYPYIQADGNCYSARCIFPDKAGDFFWHGDESLFVDRLQLFNVQDIERCENGTLFLCEGEDNLLTLKQLGFPGIAVPDCQVLEALDPNRFAFIDTLFVAMVNNAESEAAARAVAARIGYKVRLFDWPRGMSRNFNLWQLARDKGKNFRSAVSSMIGASRAFSPFASPEREEIRFFDRLAQEKGEEYGALRSGFAKLDLALDGIHGINVLGGAPKIGKSSFMIQIATEMARRGAPVLYYDFENGRQRIYQRTLARMSRLSAERIRQRDWSAPEEQRYTLACQEFKKMLFSFRVVNDRKLTPEIMRRHIDFIRHETRSSYTVVVIDSLHKLPFKDLSERRSGIDGWLRQLESIRDDMQVSFLVISELTRGDEGSYKETPHMGIFKGSGDIEYSADNAMVLFPDWDQMGGTRERSNALWLVASREHSPGLVGRYILDYPYWGFIERDGEAQD